MNGKIIPLEKSSQNSQGQSNQMSNNSNVINNMRFETKTVHAACTPDESTGACDTPSHQAAAFKFKNTQQAANIFSLKEKDAASMLQRCYSDDIGTDALLKPHDNIL